MRRDGEDAGEMRKVLILLGVLSIPLIVFVARVAVEVAPHYCGQKWAGTHVRIFGARLYVRGVADVSVPPRGDMCEVARG